MSATATSSTESAERIGVRFSALSDPTRVRIVNLLWGGELCVCDLVELLGQPQPTVSRHLTRLRRLGFVAVRRRGRFAYYRLAAPRDELTRNLLDLVESGVEADADLAAERDLARARAGERALVPCPE